MRRNKATHHAERGTILLVVVFIAAAIAGLAAISSGRVVSETRTQQVLEDETRAFNDAYAQIHVAMNVVNNSAYDEQNHNLVLRAAIDGEFGGTVVNGTTTTTQTTKGKGGGTTTEVTEPTYSPGEYNWLDHPEDPLYGLIENTDVRVYRGREYIERLQRLTGDPIEPVDPGGISDSYYVLEAAGRTGDTIRLVSALVRENQPFSSFVFFQNNATLGVSGAPRGLIHANERVAFYFSGGTYMDMVSAVEGFDFLAGATPGNTLLRDANPSAKRIDLQAVDFQDLKGKANLFVGGEGLDAEIHLQSNGSAVITEHTPPRYEMVTKSATWNTYVGWHWETVKSKEPVQVGTQSVPYEEQVLDHYDTETYLKWVKVQVGEQVETRYRDVTTQIGTQQVKKTRVDPIYEEQTVTKTRMVKKWVSYTTEDAGGGTTVGGGGAGDLGEYQWVEEEYQTTELVKVGEEIVEYWVEEPVYQTTQEPYEVTVPIYEWQQQEATRQVPVYTTVTKYRDEPIYETQWVEKQVKVYDYEPVTYTWEEEVWQPPHLVSNNHVDLGDAGGVIYIDGRITKLDGKLDGRLTIVGNEKVRVSGNLQYTDDRNREAMDNGEDYTKPYVRNSDYTGDSVLGVIARDDVVFTHTMPSSAEVNGTLMSVNGRVGIDGFWADENGELHIDSRRNRKRYLSAQEQQLERAYDRHGDYRTKTFKANSLRRIGGSISNNRVMETYIKGRGDGTSYVAAGFKRGSMKYDINLLFNPPPNFVEVPRPVLTTFMPVFLVRNNDS